MADTEKGFWHTTAGMITAIAALITALGGVVGVLVENGVIGGAPDARGAEVTANDTGAPTGSPAAVTAAEPSPTSTTIPWDRAAATFVRRDGTSATVKAATVGLACAIGSLGFKNGQSVSLERVRSVQFDAIYMENSSADGVVTLLDGRELRDPMNTWNCPVAGANEVGPVVIQLKDIRRIEFQR